MVHLREPWRYVAVDAGLTCRKTEGGHDGSAGVCSTRSSIVPCVFLKLTSLLQKGRISVRRPPHEQSIMIATADSPSATEHLTSAILCEQSSTRQCPGRRSRARSSSARRSRQRAIRRPLIRFSMFALISSMTLPKCVTASRSTREGLSASIRLRRPRPCLSDRSALYMAPRTGGSLSCHPSFLYLFLGPSVSPVQAMCKSSATDFQSHAIAVRSARNAVIQKSSAE